MSAALIPAGIAHAVMRDIKAKIESANPAVVAKVTRDIEISIHNAKVDEAKAQKRKAKRLKRRMAGR